MTLSSTVLYSIPNLCSPCELSEYPIYSKRQLKSASDILDGTIDIMLCNFCQCNSVLLPELKFRLRNQSLTKGKQLKRREKSDLLSVIKSLGCHQHTVIFIIKTVLAGTCQSPNIGHISMGWYFL